MRRLIPLLGVLLIAAGGGRPPLVEAARNADREALARVASAGRERQRRRGGRHDRTPLGELPG